jgi:16S rRNA (cytidine1402-2'-O)-methyltransferase
VLLERHGISAPLVSYHEHNERRRAGELVARVRAGETVALVSDAGTPVVSDPGWAVLQESVAAGVAVEVLPGPSAVVTALVASALPAATWRFAGFLPRREAELRAALSGPRRSWRSSPRGGWRRRSRSWRPWTAGARRRSAGS